MDFDLSDISFSHVSRDGEMRRALQGLSFRLHRGECLGIVGREGSGKTTLLHVLDLLFRPGSGTVSIDGVNAWDSGVNQLQIRSRIAFQFQFSEDQFVADTVREELLFGVNANTSLSPDSILASVGLEPTDFLHRSPFELSMGEGRRVALASLLMKSPHVLLLDEPTVGLDRVGREAFLRALLTRRNTGVTIAIASHDLDFIADLATKILVMKEGMAIGLGPVDAVLRDEELLRLAGYQPPEFTSILDTLAEKGEVARGTFLRPLELLQRLGKNS